MKRLWFLIPLAAFFALATVLAIGLKRDPREVPSPLIDKPAPRFALTRLDDAAQTIRLDDMRGKVWMLNVWASWCVACREEHPLLVEFAKKRSVPLYGLNYKDQRAEANGWLARFGNPYDASLFDDEGRVGIDFGVYGVPETFVIDQNGVIRMKHIGPLTPEVIATKIEPLAEEARRVSGVFDAPARPRALPRRSASASASASRRCGAMAKEAAPEAADPALEARMTRITSELRCLVCQNQTIADSNAGLAVDLRRETRELLRQGKSDAEVVSYMTARYGDFVLYRPPLRSTTALLWFGPAAMLLLAAFVLVLVLRRRSRMSATAFDPDLAEDDRRRRPVGRPFHPELIWISSPPRATACTASPPPTPTARSMPPSTKTSGAPSSARWATSCFRNRPPTCACVPRAAWSPASAR